MSRRDVIRWAAAGAGACLLSGGCSRGVADAAEVGDHEALHWEAVDGGLVRCKLCPNGCVVPEGKRGYCEVRENRAGSYRTLVYGKVCAAHVDPIEKKPLFHFLPGSKAFSIATAGCNVECQFCQNWEISQARPEDIGSQDLPPDAVVEAARRYDCPSIAFTYSEPTIFYEFALDTATAAKKAGVHAVTISNGFINADPMKRICEELSAVKIDLKGFTEEFYHKYVRGELKPVLETAKLVHSLGRHLELVTLLIPGLNDSEEDLRGLCRWAFDNLGPDVPMHFSRFHPDYKMKNLPVTPARTVERACEIAAEAGVHYAYVGNSPGSPHEATHCPACGETLIERYGNMMTAMHLKDGKCPACGTAIPGVWT
jgi:pyruvate formate lyase activating enzyme